MPFRPRNPYYLRISEKSVLPVYLYLDDRHLEWMSDRVLQHVLEDLRPNILPKLQTEADAHLGPGGPASAKKGTVETHRGDTYQFCYFLRKTQPHSVLLKMRTYAAAPPQKQPMMPPPPVPTKATTKRKSKESGKEPASRKKRKTKGKGRAVDDSESDEEATSEDDGGVDEEDDTVAPRRSTRSKRTLVDGDGDLQMDDGNISGEDDEEGAYVPPSRDKGKGRAKPIRFSLDLEDEEEKPKPLLHLKHRGFTPVGTCLCIVVEPWPPIRAPSRAPSIFRSTPRAPSIAPPEFVTVANEARSRSRSKTPLFLPDPDERDRSETPFPDATQVRALPLFTLDAEGVGDDEDYGGMMEFSQVLNAAGNVRAGAVDDDEDMEGAVLFGDADEIREL